MANFGASVTSGESTDTEWGLAGGTVAHGDAVYRSLTTGRWLQAQSNATATLGAAGIKRDMGVALNAAIAGGPIRVLLRGYLEACSSLSPGGVYCVSDTAAGEVVLSAALTEDTDYLCIMGGAVTATTAYVNPINTGVVVNLV